MACQRFDPTATKGGTFMEYGLIGGKLGHSYSRLIHEQVGGYAYELRPLPTEEAARAFFQARAFRAVNVTIPYKKLALACCDVVDPAAAAIGAPSFGWRMAMMSL